MATQQSIAAQASTSAQVTPAISATATTQVTPAGEPDRLVCYVQGCYFNRLNNDRREIQRHCRKVHGISKYDFDYRSIGPAQYEADIRPLWRAQQRRERHQQKLTTRNTPQPTAIGTIPQIPLPPIIAAQQLTQSVELLNIVDSVQNLGEMAAPERQNATSSYHTLNTAPINKVVDFFNLNKELEPGFKNSSGLESLTIQAATANMIALKVQRDNSVQEAEHYKKMCKELKEKFDAVAKMLEYGDVTVSSLNKAVAIMREGKSAEPALWALKGSDGLSIGTYEDGTRAAEASEEVPELEEALAAAEMEVDEEEEEEGEESSGDESEEEEEDDEDEEPEWPTEAVFNKW